MRLNEKPEAGTWSFSQVFCSEPRPGVRESSDRSAQTGLTGASAGEAPRNFSKSAQRSAAFKGTSQEQVTDTTARLLVPTLVLRS